MEITLKTKRKIAFSLPILMIVYILLFGWKIFGGCADSCEFPLGESAFRSHTVFCAIVAITILGFQIFYCVKTTSKKVKDIVWSILLILFNIPLLLCSFFLAETGFALFIILPILILYLPFYLAEIIENKSIIFTVSTSLCVLFFLLSFFSAVFLYVCLFFVCLIVCTNYKPN